MPKTLERSPKVPPGSPSAGTRRFAGAVREFEQTEIGKNRMRPAFDPKKFLASAGVGRSMVPFRKGEIVYTQGDPADSVFYIQKGKVKHTVVSGHGKEAIVGLLGPDEFFGEDCLAGQSHRTTTVAAVADCTVLRLDKTTIARVINHEPTLSKLFIEHLLNRTIRVEADLVDQLFNSSEKRLARLLLLLANFGGESRPEPNIGKISQESLAEMIGTTRSRVSFFMNRFRRLGYIDYEHDGVEVHSTLLNVVLKE
jgi:CRP-like cAMP-binding protein